VRTMDAAAASAAAAAAATTGPPPSPFEQDEGDADAAGDEYLGCNRRIPLLLLLLLLVLLLFVVVAVLFVAAAEAFTFLMAPLATRRGRMCGRTGCPCPCPCGGCGCGCGPDSSPLAAAAAASESDMVVVVVVWLATTGWIRGGRWEDRTKGWTEGPEGTVVGWFVGLVEWRGATSKILSPDSEPTLRFSQEAISVRK
jgi:hypothetical protein